MGRAGEEYIAQRLERGGYEILMRNWRTPYGEIDLVAYKNGTVYIFEIKTRLNQTGGRERPRRIEPLSLISFAQKRRLSQAARWIWLRYRHKASGFRCALLSISGGTLRWTTLPLIYDSC